MIDKVVHRRKIEEVFMYLALSIDVLRDRIVAGTGDNSIYSLYLVRYCSPNSVSSKYRQIASLDSSQYIKQD